MTILDGVKSIGSSAFYACSGLTSVTIPDSVTSIGQEAFSYCSGLTSVTIPDSVTSIDVNAFYGTPFYGNQPDGLIVFGKVAYKMKGVCPTTVTIPDSVTSIGYGAFSGCTNLTSVTIPNSVTNIGGYAFYNCSGLTNVTIPDGVVSIEMDVFSGCSGLTSVTIPDSVTSIYKEAFCDCNGLTSVTIGNSVTYIGYGAFQYCYRLTGVTIPDSVTSIESYAFFGCSRLTSVAIPNGVTSIRERAFAWSGLTSVMIPDSVTSIGDYAFRDCRDLMSVTIPNGVTSIGDEAFYSCSGLTNIVFEGNGPSVGDFAFCNVNSSCVVYVPRGSTGWGVSIPGTWNGLAIRYNDSRVEFALGGQGTRTGGGALEQMVNKQAAAVAPEVVANTGWEFIGWDADFSCVISNMTVNALWRRVYATGDAVGADATSASLPWAVGTNGVAAAKGYDDATAVGGRSVKFTATDDASAWVETVVTNACRVSFDWKSSCEPLVKGRPYDYLAFAVDGEQQAFICGETGWTSVTNYVTGEGEHVLRWTFQRDEDGSAGEDCSWLANVRVAPSVTLSFARGGATAGSVPEPITGYADEVIVLPGQGSLAWPRHSFVGWSNGVNTYAAGAEYSVGDAAVAGRPTYLTAVWEANVLSVPVITAPMTYEADSVTVTITTDGGATIYYTLDGSEPSADGTGCRPYQGAFEVEGSVTIKAIAVKDDYFDSAVASATVTRLPWTFGEYLNRPGQTFTTGGDAAWTRVKGVSADGYALRSGVITHSQTSRLETVVSGPGTVTFSCKVEGEIVKKIVYDGLAFCIDGIQQGDLMGNTVWATNVFEVVGEGSHTLSWLYMKDDGDMIDIGEDCAWLDEVTWVSSAEAGLAAWLAERNLTVETMAANGRTAAECYALGLDPVEATNDFRIVSIEMVDGKPKVEWEPKTNRWTGVEIQAVLKGAATLDGEWQTVTEENKAGFRFFKVVVEGP